MLTNKCTNFIFFLDQSIWCPGEKRRCVYDGTQNADTEEMNWCLNKKRTFTVGDTKDGKQGRKKTLT